MAYHPGHTIRKLKTATERTYRIGISKKIRRSKEPVRFSNLSFSAQVGVIAYELSHVAYFIDKSALEMSEIGIKYLEDNAFKRELETGTYLNAIKHGFGYQLLEYADLVEKLKQKYPHEAYYQTYFNFYMNSAQILQSMKELGVL